MTKRINFKLEELESLAKGIRMQLNNLSDNDKEKKDLLAPILTQILEAQGKYKLNEDSKTLK